MKKWIKNRFKKKSKKEVPWIDTKEVVKNIVNNAKDNNILASDVTFEKRIKGRLIKHNRKIVTQKYQDEEKNGMGFGKK